MLRPIGNVAVSWLKIVEANPNHNPTILSHETATLPVRFVNLRNLQTVLRNFEMAYAQCADF